MCGLFFFFFFFFEQAVVTEMVAKGALSTWKRYLIVLRVRKVDWVFYACGHYFLGLFWKPSDPGYRVRSFKDLLWLKMKVGYFLSVRCLRRSRFVGKWY